MSISNPTGDHPAPDWSGAPPDLDAVTAEVVDAERAIRILRTWGVVLLRQALSLGVLDAVRRELCAAFERLPEVMEHNPGTERTLGELGLIAPGLSPGFAELQLLSRLTVECSPVQPILAGYFNAPPVPDLDHLRFRRQTAPLKRPHVPLHQDILFYGTGKSIVNCWVPLTPCGADAPGLRVFPMPAIARFVHRGTGDDESYPMSFIQDSALDQYRARFPLAPLTPVLTPGDLLIFDGWCLHQTTHGPGMTQERLSLEARYSFEGSLGPATDRLRFDAAAGR